MVSFVVFWAALMCVLFFLIGALFKGLASIFNGLLDSVQLVLGIGILAGLAAGALVLIAGIVEGIVTQGLGEVIGTIILALVVLGLIGGLVGGLGAALLELALMVAGIVLTAIQFVLEGGSALCEKAYAHFLLVIYKRLDRC